MADKEETQTPEAPEITDDASRGAEGEEKPVREKLKNAAISSARGSESPDLSDADMKQHDTAAGSSPASIANGKSRPARKRSLEDLKEVEPGIGNLDAPATPSSGTHQRKKTRELKDGITISADDGSGSESQPAPRGTRKEGVSAETLASSDKASTPESDSERRTPAGNESPRKKRSAEEMSEISSHKQKIPATEEAQNARKSLDETRPVLEPNGNGVSSNADESRPSPKKTSVIGGFGNTTTSSPFAAFGAKAGEKKVSSFASSAAASPFGAFGGGAKPSFASSAGATASSSEAASNRPSDGSTAAKIGFASASSPFGSAGGFGATGGKLNSFASAKGDFAAPKPSGSLSSFASPAGDFKPAGSKLGNFASPSGGDFGAPAKKDKPFGAPQDEKSDESGSDNEGEDGDEDNEPSANDIESRPEVDLEKTNQGSKVPPGEEDEETLFSNRAKLFLFTDGAWKERGTGTFKLNIHRDSDLYPQREDYDDLLGASTHAKEADNSAGAGADPETGTMRKASESKGADKNKTQARFIMRAIATHRIIMNAPLFKNMLVGDPRDPAKPPLSKQMVFGVPEDGKMSQYLLKIGREDELTNLYQMIKIIQKKL